MPENPQYSVAIGPDTVVVQISLGGAFLVVPLSHEDVEKWHHEIQRQRRERQKMGLVAVNGGRLL